MKVTVDFDDQADFKRLTTFDWMESRPTSFTGGAAERERQEHLDAYIREAVARALSAKGFRRETEDPDFLVAYESFSLDLVNTTGTAETGFTLRDRIRYPAWTSGTMDIHYQQGALVLDVVDCETNQLIWWGIARAVLDLDIPVEKVERRIDEAVEKLLVSFPPSPGPAP